MYGCCAAIYQGNECHSLSLCVCVSLRLCVVLLCYACVCVCVRVYQELLLQEIVPRALFSFSAASQPARQ